MHRNTYINAPLIINKFYQCKTNLNIFFAGQICGVEGYVESICSGLLVGIFASQRLLNKTLYNLPETTACGALLHYVSQSEWRNFKPTKFSFGLLPEVEANAKKRRKLKKKEKKELKAKVALESLAKWITKAEI
jgi:methylenetetrahydrofolate--tRNA-(uracil-5-)-methyltransferase